MIISDEMKLIIKRQIDCSLDETYVPNKKELARIRIKKEDLARDLKQIVDTVQNYRDVRILFASFFERFFRRTLSQRFFGDFLSQEALEFQIRQYLQEPLIMFVEMVKFEERKKELAQEDDGLQEFDDNKKTEYKTYINTIVHDMFDRIKKGEALWGRTKVDNLVEDMCGLIDRAENKMGLLELLHRHKLDIVNMIRDEIGRLDFPRREYRLHILGKVFDIFDMFDETYVCAREATREIHVEQQPPKNPEVSMSKK